MDGYIQMIIGIVVSVVLFLLGYRQTIGAKKERILAANKDIEGILLKRVILEDFKPRLADISRLIEGKARDYRVKTRDLLSPSDFVNLLYTRVLESDIISQEQRMKNLDKLTGVKALDADSQEVMDRELSTTRTRLFDTTSGWFTLVLAIGSVVVSLGISFPKIVNLDTQIGPELLSVIGGSILAIGISALFLWYRENQETVERRPRNPYAEFEKEVVKVLTRAKVPFVILSGPDQGVDFIITVGKKQVGIEAKAWSSKPPMSMLRQVLHRLELAIEANHIQEVILLTKEPVEFSAEHVTNSRIRLLSLDQLKRWINEQRG